MGFGVPTKYLRTVCTTRLRSFPDNVPKCALDPERFSRRESAILGLEDSGTLSATTSLLAELIEHDVYALPEAGRGIAFYAWLLPTEFEALRRGPVGECALLNWLNALSVDDVEYDGRVEYDLPEA